MALFSADDDEDAEFFYDEEEVLAGAEGDASARAAMLDHYDSLLQMPRADELDEVGASLPSLQILPHTTDALHIAEMPRKTNWVGTTSKGMMQSCL